MEKKTKLLLIDDDPLIVESLSLLLEREFELQTASTRSEVTRKLQRLDSVPSLALVDLGLPPTPHTADEGLTLIGELLAFNRSMKILILSGQSERTNIQRALTLGAVDFVPKPCDAALLMARLRHQLMILDAEWSSTTATTTKGPLLGESLAIQTLRTLIQQFADPPFPVLIEGESGVGKELVAQRLHIESKRAFHPYLTINCAAFPADLLEAQLFGHSKGAFTGASAAKAGFFEETGEGTLLLDEIGEMPLALQAKLLRVLENGEYYRIGETRPRQSKARILAATNRDLVTAIRTGAFRKDLYHRLSVLTMNVPPLRERGDDSVLLMEHFRSLYAGTVPSFELGDAAEERLKTYDFPGNVRELRNIVIRLGAKYAGRRVGVDELEVEMDLSEDERRDSSLQDLDVVAEIAVGGNGFRLDENLDQWERRYIAAAIQRSGGNLSKTAKLLGINRTTLYSKMQRLSMNGD